MPVNPGTPRPPGGSLDDHWDSVQAVFPQDAGRPVPQDGGPGGGAGPAASGPGADRAPGAPPASQQEQEHVPGPGAGPVGSPPTADAPFVARPDAHGATLVWPEAAAGPEEPGVPAREPAPAAAPAPGRDPRPAAPAPEPPRDTRPPLPGPRDGGAGPVRGVPRHSGPRPPRYDPEPQGVPDVRTDPVAALTPDTVVDGAAHGPLTVRAASVRGDAHRYHGEPRQDSLAVARIGAPGGELLMLAVADGVGSAARSHAGSQEACRLAAIRLDALAPELLAALRDADDTGFARLADSAVGDVATALAHRAHEQGDDPASYATTLRVLLVPLDPAVRVRGVLAVGDGGTALLRDGRWRLSTSDAAPGGDGVIDTRTAALPFSGTADTRLLVPTQPGDVLVLCTDGLSAPLAGDAGMRDFLAREWGGAPPASAEFLWQFQYRVKSYDDDRTAVVLWDGAP